MSLPVMNPRITRYVPPAGPVYTGPLGYASYTRNVTYGGIYGGTYPFQVDIPTGYSNSTPCPILLIFGGSSSRGTDGTTQMSDTMCATLRTASSINPSWPAINVYTQYPNLGPNGGREAAYPMIPAVIAQVASEWNVDPLRRYMTGWSLGALIAWESLYQNPGVFAACLWAEGYLNDGGVTLAGGTVSPFTHTQAATVVALQTLTTGIQQHENLDDGTATPALAITAHDGYVAASHPNYAYQTHATGGHDPSNMMATYGSLYYTGWLFTQHL